MLLAKPDNYPSYVNSKNYLIICSSDLQEYLHKKDKTRYFHARSSQKSLPGIHYYSVISCW